MYNFEEMKRFLLSGREIEFRVNGSLYSFTNVNYIWEYCKDDNLLNTYESVDNLVTEIEHIEIMSIGIDRIINESLYELDSFYVL